MKVCVHVSLIQVSEDVATQLKLSPLSRPSSNNLVCAFFLKLCVCLCECIRAFADCVLSCVSTVSFCAIRWPLPSP